MKPRMLLACGLLLAGVALWQASGGDADVAADVARTVSTDAWLPPPPARTAQGLAPAAPVPAVALAASSPVAGAVAGVFDLCGLGRVSVPAGAQDGSAAGGLDALPTPLGREPMEQARERMLATLRAGPPRARVAALLLAQPEPGDDAGRRTWAQALTQQALDSHDAVALAWAEQGCGHLADGPACRLSLIRERLRLEPDNGHHWAALADEDPGATDEAWRGLQQASRWTEAPHALLLVTQAALPQDVPAYLRLALGAEISSRAAALPSPGEGFLADQCALAAAGRREACDGLARVLVDRSDSLQLLVQGHRLGVAAGWAPARVDLVQREIQALGRQGPWSAAADQPLSCAGVEAWQRHLQALAAQGELAALRQQLAQAPLAGPAR
jgi:hypothetical protein